MRQIQTLAATTSAVDWDVYLADEFDVPRIDIVFGVAPTSAGLITVTKDAGSGAAYDIGIQTINPVGLGSVAIEGLHGFAPGDKINISYANPDGVSITASATVELPILSAVHVDGMSISSGMIRSNTSAYRRYYHIDLFSSAPAASGATYEDPTSNYLGGMRLNASTDVIQSSWDVHGDWDSSTNPVLEASLTNMVDNTGGAVEDIIKFKFVLYYAQPSIPGIRSQTFYAQATVGQLAQYTFLPFAKEVDRNVTNNPILPGDHVYAKLNLEADSDITDVIINHASFYYKTTHVGYEEDDV